MLEIHSLPAREGDTIWIRWGSEAAPHQLMIDMGTEGSGKKLRDRFVAMPEGQRKLDLLVITHVDADHIGGVLTCLAEADALPGFEVGDVWFNGFVHLSGGVVETTGNLEPMGAAQGERLSNWLKKQHWNKAFAGKPVRREPGKPLQTVTLHDNLRLTVLGPTPTRLSNFIDTWKDEVHEAIEKGKLDPAIVAPGLEPMGSANPPILTNDADLVALAESHQNEFDDGKPNGTSIALLLEYKNRKLLLTGDAFSPDVVEGIKAVSPQARLHLDVFKLPHHGSRNNVHRALIEAVDCDRWLISTDGTRFKHPDAEAIARIIKFSSTPKPLLSFNVPSTFNGWWKKDAWKTRFNYETEYGTADDGWSHKFE
jgi:hypothetical protein